MMKCEDCGYTFESADPTPSCPYCGSGMVYRAGVASDAGGFREGCPWDRRDEHGFVSGLAQTIRGCLLEPAETFSRMKTEGDLTSPLLFAVILGTIGALIGIGWQLAARSFHLMPTSPGTSASADTLALVAGAVLSPALIVLMMFMSAGIIHLSLLTVGGAENGFESTFRAVCYASGSVALFQIVPICGSMVGGVWSMVIAIIGLRELHVTSTGKAVLGYFLPFIVCCGLAVVVMALFMVPFMTKVFSGYH